MKFKYINPNKAALPGIPARDITPEEYTAIEGRWWAKQRHLHEQFPTLADYIMASGLYSAKGYKPPAAGEPEPESAPETDKEGE
jgi:hypothetical protein